MRTQFTRANCLSSYHGERFSVAEYFYPADLVQPRHAHAESTLTIVLAGSLEETVGARQEHARALSAVIKPYDTEHANRVGCQGAHTLQVRVRAGTLPDELRVLSAWQWQHGGLLTASFLRVLSAFRARCYQDLECAILDLLAHSMHRPCASAGTPPFWLTQVRAQLDDCAGAPPRVYQLACSAGVHPVYLARQFRRYFGCSVSEYMARRRVVAAAQMLSRADVPLAGAAYRAGFADQSHLCRSFRYNTGITPLQYRRLVAQSATPAA